MFIEVLRMLFEFVGMLIEVIRILFEVVRMRVELLRMLFEVKFDPSTLQFHLSDLPKTGIEYLQIIKL